MSFDQKLPLSTSTLLEMLTFKRPHGSASEAEFIKRFIQPLAQLATVASSHEDDSGNFWIAVGTEDLSDFPLFTAHIDSVHRTSGMQVVDFDTDFGMAWLGEQPAGECLGADDAAGMFVLFNLIHAGVPGTYLFTRGEERGGLGAKVIGSRLRRGTYLYAVEFDRKGENSVITHQFGGRCCSDAFARELASRLNAFGLDYDLDDTGVYTDVAEFAQAIPECVNLSIGYVGEHTPGEMLNVAHVLDVTRAAMLLDWPTLPVVRDPAVPGYTHDMAYSFTQSITSYSWSDMVELPRDELIDAVLADPEGAADLLYDLLHN